MEKQAARGPTTASSWLAQTDHRRKPLHRIMAQRSTAEAIELLAGAVEIIAPSILAITSGSLKTRPQSTASRAITLGRMWRSRYAASMRCKQCRLQEPAKAPKVPSQLARM
jgi:hypothetical protein